MEVESTSNILTISGNIKAIQHFNHIKREIDGAVSKNFKEITLDILDSISITSSVIGYLVMLVNTENIILRLKVRNESLFQLLDDLNLIHTLNVQKL